MFGTARFAFSLGLFLIFPTFFFFNFSYFSVLSSHNMFGTARFSISLCLFLIFPTFFFLNFSLFLSWVWHRPSFFFSGSLFLFSPLFFFLNFSYFLSWVLITCLAPPVLCDGQVSRTIYDNAPQHGWKKEIQMRFMYILRL